MMETLQSHSTGKLVPTPVWNRAETEWPTVGLFVLVYGVFITSSLSAPFVSKWVWPFLMLINALCVYASFTVIHEASHKNISRKYPRIEYFLGFMCGLLFHGSYEQFISIHMRHHAKVNQEGLDPDFHAKGPVNPLKLLQWGATLMIYSSYYWKQRLHRKERTIKLLTSYVFLTVIYILAHKLGMTFMWTLICMFTIPSIIGVIITVYTFDHLPHRPHNDTGKYTNASVYPRKAIDWLHFMQSYHLVHHLWPSIPWYRYRECYQQRRRELLEHGAREVH